MMACKSFTKCTLNIKIWKLNYYLNTLRYKSEGTKVVLLNSFNTVGISTAYLLKKTNLFSEICMQDLTYKLDIAGVAADLNSINTTPKVTYNTGLHSMAEVLKDAGIVALLERETKKPNRRKKSKEGNCVSFVERAAYDVNKQFLKNAEICAQAAELYAKICPAALLAVTVRPVNSIIPLVCTVATNTSHNVDVRRILGFMSNDILKTHTLWSKKTKMKRGNLTIPIIGGSTSSTLIPLFSQMHPPKLEKELSEDDFKKLTEEVRMKKVKAPLATAASISRFITSLATLIRGNEMKEVLYVASNILPTVEYVAGPTQLGPAGVQYMLPFPKLSEYEKLLVDSLPFYLKVDINRGKDYAYRYLTR